MQDDSLLVRRTLAGDRQAFSYLVRKYWGQVYAQTLSMVHNSADAEELTNDIFVKAYYSLSSLRRSSSFHSWLHQIARHHCQDWLRQRPEPPLSMEEIPKAEQASLSSDSVEDQLLRQEKIDRILEAIESLPEMDRSLMQDFYLEETCYKTLQHRHHLSKAAVNMRLFRARQKVREQVKKLLSGIASLPWRDMAKSLVLRGGLETVKIGAATKIAMVGTVVVLMSGGAGVLMWRSHQPGTEQDQTGNMAVQTTRKRNVAPAVIKRSSEGTSELSEEEIEEITAFLDEFGEAEDGSPGHVAEEVSAEMGGEIPLTYEEEFRQRYIRIKETPEYKAVNERVKELRREHYGLQPSSEFRERYAEYVLNRYSVFGMTLEEGKSRFRNREFSSEELAYMTEVGEKLEQERTEIREALQANDRERLEFHQRILELMDMTDEELTIAIREYWRVLRGDEYVRRVTR